MAVPRSPAARLAQRDASLARPVASLAQRVASLARPVPFLAPAAPLAWGAPFVVPGW